VGELVLKEERGLTQECFDRLLDWLAPDREQAAMRYEEIRRRLIQIFEARGCSAPEEIADRTFDRVCEKVQELAPNYTGDPARYFYGVAKKIYLEYLRRKPQTRFVPPANEESEIERQYQCLEDCIATLPEETRPMVLEYYSEEKYALIEKRKAMAERLGITAAQLRLRMYRIREDLRPCVKECMSRNPII
jgi:DNA-directed RNA polymerase specialized sigma24 family protein